MTAFAQLEVKENSFREVPGFVNINPDENYQTDDNDLPFAVIKVRTENINDKQRRELTFSGAGYGKNMISQDEWMRLFESNGAVFLPAAGCRSGRTVDYINYGGLYWSATSNSSNDAQSMFFYDALAGMGVDGWRHRKDGLSVRLVSDVE